jgi:hypothetical protein
MANKKHVFKVGGKPIKWSPENLDAYSRAIEKLTVPKAKAPARKIQKPKLIKEIEVFLQANNIEYELEHAFMAPERKFRFDVAIKKYMIAIEYEGLFAEKPEHTGKSGHTTRGGYLSDLEKYNHATMRGWRILRYSANKEQHRGWSSHIFHLINTYHEPIQKN